MRFLDLEQLKQQRLHFDEAVVQSANIDHFCSSSMWVLPASLGLMPAREPWVWQTANGYIALMKAYHKNVGTYLQPLEGMWAFPSALLGARPLALVQELDELLQCHGDWNSVFLSGLPQTALLFQALVRCFDGRYGLYLTEPTLRHHGDLKDGYDALLARRSKNFRRSLKKSQKLQAQMAVSFEPQGDMQDLPALYQRILNVESRSWKGTEGGGITDGGMRRFYQLMLPMLVERGCLRLYFARLDGVDIGYILGAVWQGVYRGLQFSFDNAYRSLGLGNLLQDHQLRQLEGEAVHTYDLGSDSPYKRRWSDHTWQTQTLIIRRR